MLNRANVLKIAYICPNRDIMLNRTEDKPKQPKPDKEKLIKEKQLIINGGKEVLK